MFAVCLPETSDFVCFYQPTLHITDRGVSIVTLMWVGDRNQRVPSRFHDGVVAFVDRFLPRVPQRVSVSRKKTFQNKGFI